MRKNWITWVIVAAALIFAGVASAVVPFLLDQADSNQQSEAIVPSHPTVTTIDVSQLPFIGEVLVEIPFIAENIQGQPITLAQAFGIAFGVVLVSTGVVGILLTIPALLLSRLVTNVYADEDFQAKESELENRQQALLKEKQQAQPPVEATDPARLARYKANSFIVLFLVLILVTSFTVTVVYFNETSWTIAGQEFSGALIINLLVLLFSLLVLYLVFRRRDPTEIDSEEQDSRPVNWGTIWVIVTGLLIVGIGTGLAIALTPGS